MKTIAILVLWLAFVAGVIILIVSFADPKVKANPKKQKQLQIAGGVLTAAGGLTILWFAYQFHQQMKF